MNNLMNFDYEERPVRVIRDEAGAPWWVARDVCDILGIKNHRDALAKGLDDDEKGVEKADTLGGSQDLLTINESGLYNLIIRSNKSEAKKFRKWVTAEVLPSIRMNGHYSITGVQVPFTSGEAVISVQRLGEAAQGIKAAMIMARAFGFRDQEARSMANKLVKKLTGIDGLELLEVEQPRFLEGDGALYNEFLSERCEKDESSIVNSTVLYSAFRDWCREIGLEGDISQIKFGKAIAKILPRVNSRGRNHYAGVRLKVNNDG
jgi:prophage antirepressor-like protein